MRALIRYPQWVALCLVVMLTGCATVGTFPVPAKPKTPQEVLKETNIAATAAIQSATSSGERGVLTPQQIQSADGVIKKINKALDAATVALGTEDLTTLNAQVRLVNTLLWELQKHVPKEVP